MSTRAAVPVGVGPDSGGPDSVGPDSGGPDSDRLAPPAPAPPFEVPALVATDLDGTLLRSDGTVSERTRRALQALDERQVRLLMLTGRPPRWMPPVIAQTGHTGVAVCANGALVYDLASGRVVFSSVLHKEAGLRFVEALSDRLPGVVFATEGADQVFSHEPGYQSRMPPAAPRRCAREELFDGPVVKMLVRHPTLSSDELLAAATEVLTDAGYGWGGAVTGQGWAAEPAALPLTPTHSSAADGLLEVSAGGVNKASTLARLAGEWGVAASRVLAFGDMPNDVEMLRWAGWGVAVGGAHPAARAAADEVTASNDEDGVARVLERVLGLSAG